MPEASFYLFSSIMFVTMYRILLSMASSWCSTELGTLNLCHMLTVSSSNRKDRPAGCLLAGFTLHWTAAFVLVAGLAFIHKDPRSGLYVGQNQSEACAAVMEAHEARSRAKSKEEHFCTSRS